MNHIIAFAYLLILSVIGSNVIGICFSIAGDKDYAEEAVSQAQHIEEQLLKQQGGLSNVYIEEKNILGELERLEKNTAENRKYVKRLSHEIKGLSAKIIESREKIKDLNASIQEVKKAFESRLVAFYKFGKSGYLSLLIANGSLQGVQKKIKYIKAIIDHDRKIMDNLSSKRKKLEKEIGLLNKDRFNIETLKAAEKKSAAMLKKDIERKFLLLMKTHKEKEFYEKAVKELKEASHALSQKIAGLEKEEKKTLIETFVKMKGKLPMPLRGKIINGSALRNHDPFMHRKGIYIKGKFGDKIKSVFPGTVVFSGWFKGYGQMIIINHGARYFTMFAHLEERKKEAGEVVSEGEIVGNAGDTGLNFGAGMYFEIRKGGFNLDPRKWFRIN